MLGRMPTYTYGLTERTVSEPHRNPSGHAGHAHSADIAVGAAPRLCPEQSHSNQFRRNIESRYRIALSRASPPRAQTVDRRGMETLGGGTALARLSVNEKRQKAVGFGTVAMGKDHGGDCRHHESGERGERDM